MNDNLMDVLKWLVIIVVLYFLAKRTPVKKFITKKQLADEYNVSKPTITNWIRHFQSEISVEEWNQLRTLTDEQALAFALTFGDDPEFVMNKEQLWRRLESNYKTLEENVIKNLGKIGITLEAWTSCSIFPPIISYKIIEALD